LKFTQSIECAYYTLLFADAQEGNEALHLGITGHILDRFQLAGDLPSILRPHANTFLIDYSSSLTTSRAPRRKASNEAQNDVNILISDA
jgi:hypothetical protein